jgi:hypothetical protein
MCYVQYVHMYKYLPFFKIANVDRQRRRYMLWCTRCWKFSVDRNVSVSCIRSKIDRISSCCINKCRWRHFIERTLQFKTGSAVSCRHAIGQRMAESPRWPRSFHDSGLCSHLAFYFILLKAPSHLIRCAQKRHDWIGPGTEHKMLDS